MFILLFIAIMILYSFLRKKYASSKYLAEFSIVAIVFVISMLTKEYVFVTLVRSSNPLVVWDEGSLALTRIGYIFSAIYATVANIGWGGQADFSIAAAISTIGECRTFFLLYAYYGTMVLEATVFLVVITAKANYELFSMMNLFFKKIFCKKKSVYVFTALTPETMELALSIANHNDDLLTAEKNRYEKEEGCSPIDLDQLSKKDKKARLKAKTEHIKKFKKDNNLDVHRIIVFAGPTLGAFERKSEIHREVVANSFCYWSFAHRGSKEKQRSIAETIHLFNKNALRNGYEYSVYAFADDGKGNPLEEENSGFVFKDMEYRLNKIKKGRIKDASQPYDNLHIEYYILTKRDVNYRAYEAKYTSIIKADNQDAVFAIEKLFADKTTKQAGKHDLDGNNSISYDNGDLAKQRKARMRNSSQLYVVNEANLVASQAAQKMYSLVKKELERIESEEELSNSSKTQQNGDSKVTKGLELPDRCLFGNVDKHEFNLWLLGFGGTGQSVLKEIYAQTAYVYCENNEYKEYGFNVRAIDPHMDMYDGVFLQNHPLFVRANDASDYDRKQDSIRTGIKQVVNKAYFDKVLKAIETELKDNNATNDARYLEILNSLKPILEQAQNDYNKKSLSNKANHDKLRDANKTLDLYIHRNLPIKEGSLKESGLKERREKACNIWRLCSDLCAYLAISPKDNGFNSPMTLPRFKKNNSSCTAESFMDLFSPKGPEENSTIEQIERPNMVMVAIGDDYSNIELANSCIRAIASDVADRQNVTKWITIVVNIRDKRNNMLLNLKEGFDREFGILLIIVGNTDSIFSYKSVCETSTAREYNANYNYVYEKNPYGFSDINASYQMAGAFQSEFEANNTTVDEWSRNAVITLDDISEKEKANSSKKSKDELWKEIALFLKDSNRSAFDFAGRLALEYDRLIKAVDGKVMLTDSDFRVLIMMEHARWMRFHIANGFKTGPNDKVKSLLHDSLVPILYVPRSKVLYDLINVAFANKDKFINEKKPE